MTIKKPLLEERENGTYYLGPLEPAKVLVRESYHEVREETLPNGAVRVGEFMLNDDEPHAWGVSMEGDWEVAWRYFIGTDFGPVDEEYDEDHIIRLLEERS